MKVVEKQSCPHCGQQVLSNKPIELISDKPRRSNIKSLEGQKFNRLTVCVFAGSKNQQAHWICHCECGNTTIVSGSRVSTGHIKSCGCLQKEAAGKACASRSTHGEGSRPKSPEYITYVSAKSRCQNPNNASFPHYGGRGIKFLFNSFEEFLESLGRRPSPKHSLERINNEGDYSAENCKWADSVEQSNNRRSSRMITMNNKTQSLANWCRELGLDYKKILARLHSGWGVERAFEGGMK